MSSNTNFLLNAFVLFLYISLHFSTVEIEPNGSRCQGNFAFKKFSPRFNVTQCSCVKRSIKNHNAAHCRTNPRRERISRYVS